MKHATHTKCPRCKQPTITTTWDPKHDQTINPIHTDPTPLTKNQEIACAITNRNTYSYTTHWNGPQLTLKDNYWWQFPPYGKPPQHTLPQHKCGTPQFPTKQKLKPPPKPKKPDPNQLPEPPPF